MKRLSIAALLPLLSALTTALGGPRWENPDVPDVPAAFARIDTTGTPITVENADVIPYPLFSYNPYHDYQADHFQGVQRLRGAPYLVVAGSNLGRHGRKLVSPVPDDWEQFSDKKSLRGHLFVARLDDRATAGAWGKATGRFASKVEIEVASPGGTHFWHPGGISLVGDILVVPFENYAAQVGEIASQILFYDLSEPLRPRLLESRILRDREPFKTKAGAAAMARLPDGRFLVIADDTRDLAFHFSRSGEFTDGFEEAPRFVISGDDVVTPPGLTFRRFGGQSFQFVRQADGTLFLVSFRAVKEGERVRHLASLWRLEFLGDDVHRRPIITRVADRFFGDALLSEHGWGDFNAAPGLFVTDDGQLACYVTARWLARENHGEPRPLANAKDFTRPDDKVFLPAAEFWPGEAAAR